MPVAGARAVDNARARAQKTMLRCKTDRPSTGQKPEARPMELDLDFGNENRDEHVDRAASIELKGNLSHL